MVNDKIDKMLRSDGKIISEKEQQNSYAAFAAMENLMDKLKLLNVEKEFTSALKIKPMHRYYFMVHKNPGEQFFLFSSLTAWLIRKNGGIFEQPQESDDPNTVINDILDAVRNYDIAVDFPPNKLKQGVGEHVVYILSNLADRALKISNFELKRPSIQPDKEEDAEVIEDESEIILDRVEEEMMAYYSDESDDENMFNLNEAPIAKGTAQVEISNVNEEQWKLELERVLPKLKVMIRNNNRDWRTNLENMKQHSTTISEKLGGTKTQLEKMQKDISYTLEKIASREKYLNRELESILDEYRTLQDQLSKVKDVYQSISGGVTERTRELGTLTDRLESVKQEMETRGSSMTDGTPLVNIKRAISKIKAEITEMDVRIGVLGCFLLQIKVQDKKMLEDDLGQTVDVF